jgi:hypothetical protein
MGHGQSRAPEEETAAPMQESSQAKRERVGLAARVASKVAELRVSAGARVLTANLQKLRGLIDFWGKDYRKFYPWGFAMNGQTSRLEATRQIIFRLEIERIIETGTFRGTTTVWFGQFGIPVETVEFYGRHWAFSRARLSRFSNVEVLRGSSTQVFKERIADQRVAEDTRQLFYLDAHWPDLPLREELELIFSNYSRAVVMIDDFNVIDDDGYGYDNYGPEKALTLDYVLAAKIPKLHVFYPATPSHQETGLRRGSVIITSNEMLATELDKISLLRRWVPSDAGCERADQSAAIGQGTASLPHSAL